MSDNAEHSSDSEDSITSNESQEDIDPLHVEREFIRMAIVKIHNFGTLPEANRKKNVADSVKYRKKGNALYNSNSHSSQVHEKILELYSQSMALAPNYSEELALAYSNRSALLLHLKKYEECIKDCDRATDITVSDYLEAKLLCRKAECLTALNDKRAKYVCEEALQLFKQLTLDECVKNKFIETLNNIKNAFLDNNSEQNNAEGKEPDATLPSFVPQKEAPCASEAVAIKYNEKWGRHIVATRKIEPGEIIAVEKNNYTFIYPNGMYLSCSNCTHITWSSIPCKHCIYGVYCSEKCRTEAWEKYHKFECEIYPLVWDINKDIKATPCSLRLLLIAVHEVGGIQEMKKEIMDLEKNKDPRTKGFSSDRVFHSNKCRSILSLKNNRVELDLETMSSMPMNAAVALYYLARNTTFFGEKLKWSAMDLLLWDDILFIGALLLRIFYLIPPNSLRFTAHLEDNKISCFGIIVNPFCNLFNHSCDPNVKFIYSKNNEIIVYAKYPVEEEEQLFCSYYCDFLDEPKDVRRALLLEAYQFECNCLPCAENWSNLSLPCIKHMLESDPKSITNLLEELKDVKLVFQDILCQRNKYKPVLMEELTKILKIYAEKASVHCQDYEIFDEYMFRLYNRSFGFWHVVPDTC